MNFESLPNQIILILFEYFSLIELFDYFSGLNSCFNKLLNEEFNKFHLDFRSLSKLKMNEIFENKIPSIINKIISIDLRNDFDAPQQIELFISRNDFKLRQLINLKSISISNLKSKEIFEKIMIECSYLSHLTHLTLFEYTIKMNKDDAEHFFNQIWSLSKLKYCHLGLTSSTRSCLSNPPIISKSLKYLYIPNTIFSLSTFSDLCRYTPNLLHVSTRFDVHYNELQILKSMYSITRLNILFYGLENMLEHVLENLPNLYQLKCDLNVYINGYQWENIIKKSLRKLQILEIKMRFSPSNNQNKENQLNEIINSYRTYFWINEHQWFIRCHWYSIDENDRFNFIDVFTVPYAFENFWEDNICLLGKSTVLYDNEYLQCPFVKTLNYGSSSFTDSIRSHLRFNNLEHLSLSLPFNERFFFIISKFDRLKSLFIYTEKNKNLNRIQYQLQLILDQASHLHSLEFSTWSKSDSEAPLTGLYSASVRQLNLIRFIFNDQTYHFDEKEIIELSRSPLGIQCEFLSITVKKRNNILDLIHNMKNLRSLYVHSIDHYYPENGSISSAMDGLVQWLNQQLPSTSTVTKSENDSFGIQISIR